MSPSNQGRRGRSDSSDRSFFSTAPLRPVPVPVLDKSNAAAVEYNDGCLFFEDEEDREQCHGGGGGKEEEEPEQQVTQPYNDQSQRQEERQKSDGQRQRHSLKASFEAARAIIEEVTSLAVQVRGQDQGRRDAYLVQVRERATTLKARLLEHQEHIERAARELGVGGGKGLAGLGLDGDIQYADMLDVFFGSGFLD